jgi:hypothetical protein
MIFTVFNFYCVGKCEKRIRKRAVLSERAFCGCFVGSAKSRACTNTTEPQSGKTHPFSARRENIPP